MIIFVFFYKQNCVSKILSSEAKIKVRFNEVDALKIVWHGHYINYFEDGRQDFGRTFGLGYLDFFDEGYTVPIVEYSCKNKLPLTFGDDVIVRTTFRDNPAAKIIFDYEIINAADMRVVATGYTIQVFLDSEGVLVLNNPDFYMKWKKNWAVI